MPERIYRGTLLVLWGTQTVSRCTNHRTNTAAAGSQQAVSPAWWPFFFFFLQDLALIHSHSSDLLTPKGPCPAVTEQSPPPNLAYRPACSAKNQTEDSCYKLLSHHRNHLFSSEWNGIKKVFTLNFLFCFYFSDISLFVNCTSMLCIIFIFILHCTKPLSWSCGLAL